MKKEFVNKPSIESMAKRLDDERELQESPVHSARRELIEEINSMEPNVETAREHVRTLLLRGGPDVIFEKDNYIGLSINDAMIDNKDRAAAKPCIDMVSERISESMKNDNWRKKVQRESSDRMFRE